MERSDAHFVECGVSSEGNYIPPVDEVLGDYPTLRATTDQTDPGLTHTIPISDVNDLKGMNDNLSGNYYLTGDIDASATAEYGWDDRGSYGWLPIGSTDSPFTGTFDGCGYTISDLYINRSISLYQYGLFGLISTGAKIANVTMTDCDITGGYNIGALVGQAYAETTAGVLIQNCHVSGEIKSGHVTPQKHGGLVGYSQGTASDKIVSIYDCTSSCTVDNVEGGIAVQGTSFGGFVGLADYTFIYNCSATGALTSVDAGSGWGGFVGEINYPSYIEYCYSTGDVEGEDYVGGFVGTINVASAGGYIRKCYSTGNVTSDGMTSNTAHGGFAGHLANTFEVTDCYSWGNVTFLGSGTGASGFTSNITDNNISVTNCYCIGLVTGSSTPAGFCYTFDADSIVADCYWDIETSGLSTSTVGEGRSTTWLKTNPNYPDSWDFDTIWYQDYTAPVPAQWNEVNLNHLEGETVSILADGVVYPDQVVTDGDIDNTDFENATEVHIGLKYTSKLKPMKPLSQPNMMKRRATCKQMGLSFHNTDDSNGRSEFIANTGVRYGVHDDDMKQIDFNDNEWKNKCDKDDLFTGSVAVAVPSGFNVNMPLQIITDSPLPCVVRAMIPKVDVTGT